MPSYRDHRQRLDRACVRGKVIKSSLDVLAADLRDLEPDLRDDVIVFSRRFDEYVHRLEAASYLPREPAMAR